MKRVNSAKRKGNHFLSRRASIGKGPEVAYEEEGVRLERGRDQHLGPWRPRWGRWSLKSEAEPCYKYVQKIYPFFSPLLTQPQSSILEPYNHGYLVNSGWRDTIDCTKSLQVPSAIWLRCLECTDTCGRLALILWRMRSKSCLHCPSTMFAPSSTCWPPKNERKHGRSSRLYFKNSFKLYLLHTHKINLSFTSAHTCGLGMMFGFALFPFFWESPSGNRFFSINFFFSFLVTLLWI